MIRSAWDLAMHIVGTSPTWGWPMLASVLLTILVTQYVKKAWLPSAMSSRERHRVTQLVAVVIGMGTSFVLWPADLHWKHGAVVGAIVSFGAPALYPIGMKIIEHRWPWLREKFSGDTPTE
jgi:hypothetical protein